jgi:hypothetical protein
LKKALVIEEGGGRSVINGVLVSGSIGDDGDVDGANGGKLIGF